MQIDLGDYRIDSIAESVLHNTMQTLASEFKRTREPKIQKFRGGTSSGALLVFKSWMQDIKCAIKDRNLNNEEALQLVKEFSKIMGFYSKFLPNSHYLSELLISSISTFRHVIY